MKTFLLFLAWSLVASEKLDRTYLPPPGAKFSGGSPGDIQAPFDITQQSTSRPQSLFNKRPVTPEDTRIEVGINRGVPSDLGDFQDSGSFSSGSNVPVDYNKVPTTTTSYAFTQTTTRPPGEGFETTLGPINPVTGLPTASPFNELQTAAPGFSSFPQNTDQGQRQQVVSGFQQPGIPSQQTGLVSTPGIYQYPTSTTPVPTLGSPTFVGQSRPGYQQDNFNQYQDNQQGPGFSSEIQRPGFFSPPQDSLKYQNNQYTSSGQIPSNIPIQGSTVGSPQFGNKIQESVAPGFNTPYAQTGLPFAGSNVQGVPGLGQQVPSSFINQGTRLQPGANIQQPGTQFVTNIGEQRPGQINYQPRPGITPQPNQVDQFGRPLQPQLQVFPTGSPNAPVYNQNIAVPGFSPQQIPTQVDEFGRPIPPRPGQIISAVSPTNIPNKYPTTPGSYPTTPGSYPTTPGSYPTTPGSYPTTPGSYPTTPGSYPTTSGSYPTTGSTYPIGSLQSTPSYPGIIPENIRSVLSARPERPQADGDRNAVILDYQSVITPDGEFSYTFDTSNGIHADESGTAKDGVKAKGSYSYIGDDGKLYSVVYTADENGFQPRGDHLPTPPPIPDAIQKIIDQVNRDKDAGISDDGSYNEAKYGYDKYQGGKNRPQKPNQNRKPGVDFSNTDDYSFDQVGQQRPQNKYNEPVSTEENPQEYDEIVGQQDLISGVENLDGNRRRPISQFSSRRPGNQILSQEEGKYISSDGKIPSRRPGINRDDAYGETSSIEDKDISQLGEESPFVQPGQLSSGKRPIDKISSGRPYSKPDDFDTTYEDGSYITDTETSQPSSTIRPVIKGYSRRPMLPTTYSPVANQYFDRENDNILQNVPSQQIDNTDRVTSNNVPSRIPGDRVENNYDLNKEIARIPTSGRPVEGSDTYNKYNENRRRPQVSTAYAPQIETEDGYEGNTIPGKTSFGSSIRRPVGQRPTGVNRYVTARPNVEQGSTFAPQSVTEDEFDSSHINVPGKGGRLEQNIRKPGFIRRPGGINKFTTVRPGAQEDTFIPQSEGETGAFDQKLRGSSSRQRPGGANRYTTVKPFNEKAGYQYIPPQRKFEQGSQFPGSPTLQDKTYFEGNEESNVEPSPFTTPEANLGEERPGQGIDGLQGIRPGSVRPNVQGNLPYPNRPSLGNQQREDNLGQNIGFNKNNVPSENAYNRPGINRTPGQSDEYSSQNTGPIGKPGRRPSLQGADRYKNTQSPKAQGYDFVSTTRMPPQNTKFGIQTTDGYDVTPSQSPYQTTYRPIGSNVDSSTITGPVRPGSQVTGRPDVYPQNQLPSTTYRPGYYSTERTDGQSGSVDAFGRPIETYGTQGLDGTTVRPGYAPGRGSQNVVYPQNLGGRQPFVQSGPSVGAQPGMTKYGRPIAPGQSQEAYFSPESPSSTERVIGEDFSGPKQQQRFDPERGYYY